MRRIAKFLALAPSDQALVLSALAPLLAMSIATRATTFTQVRRIADAMSRPMRGDAAGAPPSPDRIVRAVTTASVVVPRGDNCLVCALATGIVLKRYGYPSELKIGVMKSAGGRFEAHAWLESGRSVVMGDFQLDQYTPLAAPDSVAG